MRCIITVVVLVALVLPACVSAADESPKWEYGSISRIVSSGATVTYKADFNALGAGKKGPGEPRDLKGIFLQLGGHEPVDETKLDRAVLFDLIGSVGWELCATTDTSITESAHVTEYMFKRPLK